MDMEIKEDKEVSAVVTEEGDKDQEILYL